MWGLFLTQSGLALQVAVDETLDSRLLDAFDCVSSAWWQNKHLNRNKDANSECERRHAWLPRGLSPGWIRCRWLRRRRCRWHGSMNLAPQSVSRPRSPETSPLFYRFLRHTKQSVFPTDVCCVSFLSFSICFVYLINYFVLLCSHIVQPYVCFVPPVILNGYFGSFRNQFDSFLILFWLFCIFLWSICVLLAVLFLILIISCLTVFVLCFFEAFFHNFSYFLVTLSPSIGRNLCF